MSAATLNGRPQRKQLSDQLDRLDSIIDVLADGLPEAVRDAVVDGTQAALKQVLIELLADPEIRARIAPPNPPEVSQTACRSGSLRRILDRARTAVAAVAERSLAAAANAFASLKASVAGVRERVRSAAVRTVRKAATVYAAATLAWQFKNAVIFGVAIGLAAAIVATASHSAAAVLAGVGTGVAATSLRIGLWARRALVGLWT